MWFIFALLYAVLLGVVIVFDRFIVKNIFTSPLQGLFITIPTSIALLAGLAPLIQWPSKEIFALAFLAGAFLQVSQFCYFYALEKAEEAGNLSALEATYPVLVAIGTTALGNYLSLPKWVGIFIVIFAVSVLSWEPVRKVKPGYYIFLVADIIFLALHGLLADHVLTGIPFLSFYGPYSVAIVVMGILPFVISRKERTAFLDNWKNIRTILPHLSLMEIANILGVISAVYALSIGHAALVTVVMTTYPAVVFILSAILVNIPFFRDHGFEPVDNLYKKIGFTLVIALGLGLVGV